MSRPVLILASRSPRRRELLTLAGIEHVAIDPAVSEAGAGAAPAELVVENARLKARAGLAAPEAADLADLPSLGADTEVALGDEVLGKAESRELARSSLERLAGREHEVLSAVVVAWPGGEERSGVARTRVRMRELGEPDPLLERYLDSGEWRDRAGAYAVQGLGSSFVEAVEGDLANVIGLPLGLLAEIAPELFADPPGAG